MSLAGTLIVVAWFAVTFGAFRAHPVLGLASLVVGALATCRAWSRIRRSTLAGCPPSAAERTRLLARSAGVASAIVAATIIAGGLPLALAVVAVTSDVGGVAFAAIVLGPLCGVLLAMSAATTLVRRLW